MKILKLALMNFKNSFKSYLSLVISLAFTIMILYNFQNTIYSEAFAVLGTRNKDLIDMLIRAISFVLGCFMFFFIWYATNVFLTRRKKEIGIYIFMGMSNRKIGSLYLIEISFVGITALALGIGFGALLAGLFQMIMGAVSDLAVDIKFGISLKAIKVTFVSFLLMYFIFALKGYRNITHSSVLSMISATRQNEYVRQKNAVLLVRSLFGVTVLSAGYYFANKGGRNSTMQNALLAVVLVILGVYLLFGGLIPLIFQLLVERKGFLYRRQRCLWVNQVIFRIRKNYRTYAMVCVIGICSITALATGFATRERYHNMVAFNNQYTFQLISNQSDLEEKATALIREKSDIAYQNSLCALAPDERHFLLAYSDIERIARQINVAFPLPEPSDDETFFLAHTTLLSFFTNQPEPVTIAEKTYQQTQRISSPYLGYIQKEMACFYIVSDREYERLKPQSTVLYIHNYKISDDLAFLEARDAIDVFISNTDENFTARAAVDPQSNELEWIKTLHPLCIFMFLVFIVAGGCIMFMKLYNDSFEERERYIVLKKLGFSKGALSLSIAHELMTAYLIPFVVMAVSAYFSVHALGKMMYTSLSAIYVVSTFVVFVIFGLCYVLSLSVYRKLL